MEIVTIGGKHTAKAALRYRDKSSVPAGVELEKVGKDR
jgi:hypothetical protein